MKRVLSVVLAAMAVIVAAAGVAAAAEPPEVADEIDARWYFVEPGAEEVDEAALDDVIRDAREAGERLGVAVLADDPGQGTYLFADEVLDHARISTVLVVSPGEVGAASDDHGDEAIDGALDRAVDEFDRGGSVVDGAATFAEELSVRAGGGTAAAPGTGGGIGTLGLLLFLGAIVLLGAMTLTSSARQRRRLRTRGAADLATARTELRRQTQAVADDILATSDKLSLAESQEAHIQYGKATEAYQAVQGAAESAPALPALAEVADDLDRARWHLESARAAAEGRQLRRSAARSSCFFDPVHGAGAEEATLRSEGREDLPVRVCTSCADTLRDGGHPPEHRVTVGMRELPVVMAPRAFGGAELSWLGAFELVPGGGDPVAFEWSRYSGGLPSAVRPKAVGSGSTTPSTRDPSNRYPRRSGFGWGWLFGWGWGRYGHRRHRGYGGGWSGPGWGGGGWGGGWGGGSRGGGSVSRGATRGGTWGGGSTSRGGSRGGGSISRGGSRGGGSISRGGSRGGGSRGGGSRGGGSRGGGSRRR